MQLSCIHCGRAFTITTEQLGGRGHCPHCHAEIHLPSAETEQSAEQGPAPPSHWWENSISGLASMLIHMVLFLVLALVSFTAGSGAGLSEDVLIGDIPSVVLSPAQEEQLSAEAPSATQSTSELTETLEVEAPVQPTTTTDSVDQFAVVSPSTGGASTSSFDLGGVSIGGGSMAGGGWEGLMQNLRRNGLDIVLTFDSTGSMEREIRAVENQIQRIGSALLKLVPKARISICTYRDEGDDFVVKGLPLTGDISAIDQYLNSIYADGGGDMPEAVDRGLDWSIRQNEFRPQARKVILIFGDAPPHSHRLSKCLEYASDFSRQQKGIVSTVTCRSGVRLPEFVQIAEAGGGEAFLTTDERQIMTQLLVLVFGSAHRDKVIEAFKLLDR